MQCYQALSIHWPTMKAFSNGLCFQSLGKLDNLFGTVAGCCIDVLDFTATIFIFMGDGQ